MNTLHHGFSQRDWLALSLLPSIGANRLASLWTYLSAWSSSDQDTESLILEACSSDSSFECAAQSVDFQVLRALGWSEHVAKAADVYLQNGRLPYEVEERLEQTERWLSDIGQSIVFRDEANYPELLKQIAVPPLCLFVKGTSNAWARPCIGVVGSRNASGYGRSLAQEWSERLASHGYAVCSGGAKGIDTYAHQGALTAQSSTVAVMGAGLLNWYPRQNYGLFERIIEQEGALISEYPLTTQPRPNLFPPRNRIISGMSHGVLVVEASEKSGSLISARYALEENREVFAIPGRVGDPQSSGTNHLIRQGATLVRSIDEMIEELPRESRLMSSLSKETTTPSRKKVPLTDRQTRQSTLQTGGLSGQASSLLQIFWQERISLDFDALIRKTGMGASELAQILMELELSGQVINAQGHYQYTPTT
ncbi:DNA-processing protein DprA [Marinomonas ostreistagni]|uniref:DNA-protecting protein DprA n=1 Tax=Marinomonas ostreistagni TaxID=359209 RepID=A0ABS0ZD41_9GAMM|nr:DNA-processing protein DprA [Marinomonas ostreistagni]MBJ7551593.1 DNA-protecting protein DprA [Marinomonas ostreistagni]